MSAADLVAELLELHRPSPVWNGGGRPLNDTCKAGCREWPCVTRSAIQKHCGGDLPESQVSGTFVGSPIWVVPGGEEMVRESYPEEVAEEEEMIDEITRCLRHGRPIPTRLRRWMHRHPQVGYEAA